MSGDLVLVIGVGGIGGPAAMALVRRLGPSLRLVDPDVVEASNLPRQVLFTSDDVGQRKALVAAKRLGGAGTPVEGVVERFDESTATRLLKDVRVAIDATDGAATKDLVTSLVVEAGVALIHAAAIQSEGRLLDVPAGGRPCIACVFGYASEGPDATGDTCARVGVWPSIPGAIGALAAHATLRRLERPAALPNGLQVLDFATPRALALGVRADAACPACGSPRRRPRPVADACVPTTGTFDTVAPAGVLDLRLEHCPMNLLRARTAIEATPHGTESEVWLGAEGAETVPSGLAARGHRVLVAEPRETGLRIVVRRDGSAPSIPAVDEDARRRYARQIVLGEFGEAGQSRLRSARVVVRGDGEAAEAAVRHLDAAGVGATETDPRPLPGALSLDAGSARIASPVRASRSLARFEGAVAADALMREIVTGTVASSRIDVSDEGVVRTVEPAT